MLSLFWGFIVLNSEQTNRPVLLVRIIWNHKHILLRMFIKNDFLFYFRLIIIAMPSSILFLKKKINNKI